MKGLNKSVTENENKTLAKSNSELNKPLTYELVQNYPNPFNPSTTINFSIAKEGQVLLKIYDILGAEVASIVDEFKPAGIYSIQFNASNLTNGVYVYRLDTPNFTQTKKMMLVK